VPAGALNWSKRRAHPVTTQHDERLRREEIVGCVRSLRWNHLLVDEKLSVGPFLIDLEIESGLHDLRNRRVHARDLISQRNNIYYLTPRAFLAILPRYILLSIRFPNIEVWEAIISALAERSWGEIAVTLKPSLADVRYPTAVCLFVDYMLEFREPSWNDSALISRARANWCVKEKFVAAP
jgi:hypothetical protein